MVLLQLAEGSQGHGWPKPLHRLSGSENREECWLCFDYKRLYKFQKIDFSRPPWLGMKARRVFIESGPRWLDFLTLTMWPMDPTMNVFCSLTCTAGAHFPRWVSRLGHHCCPLGSVCPFPALLQLWKSWRSIYYEQCNDQGTGGDVCPLDFGCCLYLPMVPVTRRLYYLTIIQRVIKRKLGRTYE